MAAGLSMHHLLGLLCGPPPIGDQGFVDLDELGVEQAIELIFPLQSARCPGWPPVSHASVLD